MNFDIGRSGHYMDEAEKMTVHCWEDGPATDDGCGTTCLLKANHAGPHQWTRDDEITIIFRDT